jgi:hypothetical protein
MDADAPCDSRLLARIEGDRTELQHLRSALTSWIEGVGVEEEQSKDLVLAAHELAAEAIERGAVEVAILAELLDDASRLTVAGGDWSSLDELRTTLVRGLVPDIRVHHGIATVRLKLHGDEAHDDEGSVKQRADAAINERH